MKNCNPLKVRKGAWGSDEDDLLRKCIHKFGEGKWHLVPQRAGLNRCRKSCRLRWLNYLRPTIKRGDFGEDEVDLMMRLHKLLGNRLPGRTANDVKNFWNTNLEKKLTPTSFHGHKEEVKGKELIRRKQINTSAATTHTLVKPLTLLQGTSVPYYSLNLGNHMYSPPGKILKNRISSSSNERQPPAVNSGARSRWKRVVEEFVCARKQGYMMKAQAHLRDCFRRTWSSSNLENFGDRRGPFLKTNESKPRGLQNQEDCRSWSDIWNLLNSDYI